MLRARICILLLCVTCLASIDLFAQRDLIPPSDPVYKFLLRQETNGTLNGFHWGMLPLSRREVAGFLDSLENSGALSATDRGILRDLQNQTLVRPDRLTLKIDLDSPGAA
jgi:hypothetical protein